MESKIKKIGEGIFKLKGPKGVREKSTGKIYSEAVGTEKDLEDFELLEEIKEEE